MIFSHEAVTADCTLLSYLKFNKVTVTNNSKIDFDDDTEIKLIITIGQEGKEILVGEIGAFKSKETKEFTYQYTITEKGEVTSTVKLLFNGEELGDTLFEEALSFTVKAVRASSDDNGGNQNSGTDTSPTNTKNDDTDKNSGTNTSPTDTNTNSNGDNDQNSPKTGSEPLTGLGLTMLLLVSASAIAVTAKRKEK